MSILLANGYVCKVQAWAVDAGQAAVNTWYYRVVSVGAPAATDADLAQSFETNIASSYKAIISARATFRGVLAQIILPQPPSIPQVSNALAGVGTDGPDALPKQVSALTSWKTALAGQAYRGRTYWPFASTNANTSNDGLPTSAYLTKVTTLSNFVLNYTAVSVGGRTATVKMVLYHRALLGSTDIIAGTIRTEWATQRKRGGFGRLNTSPV